MKLKNKSIYQLEKKLKQLEHDGIKTYRIGHIKNQIKVAKQNILIGKWKAKPMNDGFTRNLLHSIF